MAATEKPTVDTTIKTCYEGVGKNSHKPYMTVALGNGQKTTNFAVEMFQDFKDAQQSGAQVRLTLYESGKGYTSIDAIDPVPRAGDPPAKHFTNAGGAPPGTPGTPENPGPRTAAAPAGGNGGASAARWPSDESIAGPRGPNVSQSEMICNGIACLFAAMVAWGGRFVQDEASLWRMTATCLRVIKTGEIPGIKKPDPVVQPDASPREALPAYDEDL